MNVTLPGRTFFSGLPVAIVLASGAGVIWFGHASSLGLAIGILAALGGGFFGYALASSRVRSWFISLLLLSLVPLGVYSERFFVHFWLPLPRFAHWGSALAEGIGVFLTTVGLTALAAFWCDRRHTGVVVPAAVLVVGCALLLRQHRGGAIHLPYAISDSVWISGWHPALVLAGLGGLAAFVASWGLYRAGSARRPWVHFLGLAVLVLLVTHFAPRLGLLELPGEDPLRLAGNPESVRRGGRETGPSAEHTDPLRLALPRDGRGGASEDMVPFLDEYPTEGNQTPVAVVVLHDDVVPLGGVFYFRQVAFSVWNGRRLVRSFEPGVDADMFISFPSLESLEALPPPDSPFRQSVPSSTSLIRDHVLPPVLAQGRTLEPLDNPDPALFRRSYGALSLVLTGDPAAWLPAPAGDPAWPDSTRAVYLRLPDDPRYQACAEEILATLRPEYRDRPWARAMAISFWLEAHTQYSVRSKHADAPDPTASFLFGDRIGYCVHLAHAAALLARALGLPSRVAAGYAYQNLDRSGGSAILLRSGDAHAWAEVFLEGIGWVPVDPAPPSLDPPMAPLNLDLQRLLGEMARPRSRTATEKTLPAWSTWSWSGFFWSLLGLAVTWISAGYTTKIWRRGRAYWSRRDPDGRLALRASLDRLGEAGWVRHPGETREAFAVRLKDRVPSFDRLTHTNLAARFGGRKADPALARQLGRRVARETARSGGWRRWRGIFSPWSWTKSR